MTNLERIRDMNISELADFICTNNNCADCNYKGCIHGIQGWLLSEYVPLHTERPESDNSD